VSAPEALATWQSRYASCATLSFTDRRFIHPLTLWAPVVNRLCHPPLDGKLEAEDESQHDEREDVEETGSTSPRPIAEGRRYMRASTTSR
jgi:hypothetical protein